MGAGTAQAGPARTVELIPEHGEKNGVKIMSKGPGKWQRLIMTELAIRDRFNLQELLGETFTKAEYNALHRAAMQLERAGKIKVHRFALGGGIRTWICHFMTEVSFEDRQAYNRAFKKW